MEKIKSHPWLSLIVGILILLILFLVAIAFIPFKVDVPLVYDPAEDYAEAVSRIEAIQEAEDNLENLHPVCKTKLLTHGEKTDNVIVFFHGFSNCPQQFVQLAEEYYQKGYNVYIPRLPHHGFADKSGHSLSGLTAEELTRATMKDVDIAQGLGDRVVIAGLSAGGSMGMWVAQYRNDVDAVYAMSPFVGIKIIPRAFNRYTTKLMLVLPDFHMWWDLIKKENNPYTVEYATAGYMNHSLFEVLRFGFAMEEDMKKNPPLVDNILVIYNENDESVNNGIVEEFIQIWQNYGPATVQEYLFEKSMDLPHDFITPEL